MMLRVKTCHDTFVLLDENAQLIHSNAVHINKGQTEVSFSIFDSHEVAKNTYEVKKGTLAGYKIILHGGNRFSIKKNNFYLTASPNLQHLLNDRPEVKAWEIFEFCSDDNLGQIERRFNYSHIEFIDSSDIENSYFPISLAEVLKITKQVLFVKFSCIPGAIPLVGLFVNINNSPNVIKNRITEYLLYLEFVLSKLVLSPEFFWDIRNECHFDISEQRVFLMGFGDQACDLDYCLVPDKPLSVKKPYLIPDVRFFIERGYSRARESLLNLKDWNERIDCAYWRGSSSGVHNINSTNYCSVPRIRLCAISSEYPELLDAKITSLVQTESNEEKLIVESALKESGFLSSNVNQLHFSNYKYLVEIDGNVTPWSFLLKLMLGSCVLRVESSNHQWFYSGILPWIHYVPVKADLSDLAEVILWCRSHPEEVSAIASMGREFANKQTFFKAMTYTAKSFLKCSLSLKI